MQFHYPPDLPVSQHRDRIIEVLQNNQVIIVAGETGSGKTTQLPKMCLEILHPEDGVVGCTQPRRIAASTVSARVTEELGEYGCYVGYKIRFHDHTSDNTKIKFMTDGILLAESRSDPLLEKYNILIIDEAHERSLNIDFLLGCLRNILPKRPDLKIIITSATIDTDAFSKHFGMAPIISIGGKTFPIEMRYLPPKLDEYGEYDNYIDHCVNSVYDLYMKEPPGDMLVFLPTEKDIRSCCELLKKMIDDAEVLPLFGRLHSSDQKKIFGQFEKTKIVVATNVAETSITVPGIRYVIDTGLARMAYYNFRSKTNSLPICKISRASCDQRKGRCGRIAAGLCIRLYTEEDFLNREEFTLPEITRSNLAEVILQMLSFNLGDPFNFPFIDPPHASAIRDGYKLLHELGAIDTNRQLTNVGRTMSAMPIDPCIGRIVIEAEKNSCLKEIKIIGSALAIQDPRVRPAELEKKADQAHELFAHPQSDFMSLLNIWNLFHQVNSKTSWSRLKKFCKTHFLSFQRMREWLDLHEQMSNVLKSRAGFTENEKGASYEDIHRSLTIGFLRNLAEKKKGKIYQGPSGKEVMIFPGSHLFSKPPKWILAASFLETNRLYALTVASINPDWLESLGGDLCKYSWSQPRYNKKSGQVIADEKVTLFGLVIVASRRVNFGRTSTQNQKEARIIFIQSALLEGQLTGTYRFLIDNLDLIEKWENVEHQLRCRDLIVNNDILFQFYDDKIPPNVHDRFTLNRFLRKKRNVESLKLQEHDILNRKPDGQELADFPRVINIGSHQFPLSYLFDPQSDEDGVTVRIPYELADTLNSEIFEWLVPGLIKEKTTLLLRGLPKKLRKHLIPLNITVDRFLDDVDMYKGSFFNAIENSIFKQFKINIKRSDWPDQLPRHLRMRFSFYDISDKQVAAGREFSKSSVGLKNKHAISKNNAAHKELVEINKWEALLVKTWNFQGLPDKIPLFTPIGQIAGYLYPAVTPVIDKGAVTITFHSLELEARKQNQIGMPFLYRLHFSQQFKALKNYCNTTLSGPSTLWLFRVFKTKSRATESLLGFVLKTIFKTEDDTIPSHEKFETTINNVKEANFFKEGADICNIVIALLRLRKEVFDRFGHYEALAKKSRSYSKFRYQEYNKLLLEILPEDFLIIKNFKELGDCDRYMRSLSIRIERAHADFTKDDKKASSLEPHISNLKNFQERRGELSNNCLLKLADYKSLIQEMRISIFSPEIKTKFPISSKKISRAWQDLNKECG